MKSMTGFGVAEAVINGLRFKAELSSVNSKKGIDLLINLPRDFSTLEKELRLVVEKEVSRGRIMLTLQTSNSKGRSTTRVQSISIDKEQLKKYQRELKNLAKEVEIEQSLSLEFLLKLPGVMKEEASEVDTVVYQEGLLKLVKKALTDFQKSRDREGQHLCQDLGERFILIEAMQTQVAALQPSVLKKYRDQLFQRVREAGVEVTYDDERLLKEIVLFSDRSDISEEQTRLKAHLVEARRLLKSKKSIGRNLDFLIQEIGREINTTGSKANDVGLSKLVVEMKTELEKIREQVQNLE